jgi:hypothetical protein
MSRYLENSTMPSRAPGQKRSVEFAIAAGRAQSSSDVSDAGASSRGILGARVRVSDLHTVAHSLEITRAVKEVFECSQRNE